MTTPRTLDPALFAALFTALVTALLYATGWAYAYHFYGRLNLGLMGLGIPVEYHFMYGFWALRQAWWWLLPLLFAGWAVWVFRGESAMRWVGVTMPLWLPLLFLALYALGREAALADYREHAREGFIRYPLARVWLKETTSTEPRLTRVAEGLREGRYRLLVEGRSRFYLVKARDGAEPSVVVVSGSEIRAMRVVPVNPGR